MSVMILLREKDARKKAVWHLIRAAAGAFVTFSPGRGWTLIKGAYAVSKMTDPEYEAQLIRAFIQDALRGGLGDHVCGGSHDGTCAGNHDAPTDTQGNTWKH